MIFGNSPDRILYGDNSLDENFNLGVIDQREGTGLLSPESEYTSSLMICQTTYALGSEK